MTRVAFEVEQAGCESCGKLIATALGGVATVDSVEVDEAADTASVVLSDAPSRHAIDVALAEASDGAGHVYGVRDGSWRTLS